MPSMMNNRTRWAAAVVVGSAMAAIGVTLAPHASAVQHGRTATTSAYPWVVSLQLDGVGSGKQYCGGTLVAPTKVVTAGHCYDPYPPDPDAPYPPEPPKAADRWTVVAGRTDLRRTDQGAEAKVAQVWVHPGYYGQDRVDLAVFTLDRPLPFRTLPLAGPGDGALYAEGTPATVLGWGLVDKPSGPVLPHDLHQGAQTVHSADVCERVYTGDSPHNAGMFTSGSYLCAGEDGRAVARPDKHDSGGPLYARGKLIGVVSGGRNSADPSPSLYAKIATHHAELTAEINRALPLRAVPA